MTECLKQCALPSPPSTLLLSSKQLRVTDPEVRTAVVRRILRFISPRPWGSLSAEVNGNREALDNAVSKAWNDGTSQARRAFSAGSDVLWIPYVMRHDGLVRERDQIIDGEEPLWLVQRAPPMRRITRLGQEKADLALDVTDRLTSTSQSEVLWDCRFSINLDPNLMPRDIRGSLDAGRSSAKVIVTPYTKWFLPRLVLRREGQLDTILAEYPWDLSVWKHRKPGPVQVDVPWARMSFVRSWEAI